MMMTRMTRMMRMRMRMRTRMRRVRMKMKMRRMTLYQPEISSRGARGGLNRGLPGGGN